MNQRFIGLAFIMTLWFVISFVTNILGPIMPLVIKDFGLSLALAGFLPFSFFLAYGVVSIPAGLLIERIGAKNALIFALVINLAGAAMFAIMPAFATAVLALFVIGMGMAMLQVVINPLTRTVGGEANYPFFSVMGQLVFGLASFVSPWVFQAVMSTAARRPQPAVFVLAPQSLPWVILYWLFLVLFAGAVVLTFIMPLPRVELQEDERVEGVAFYRELLRQPKVWGFFVGIACYVATEQSLANWMSKFLETYHGFSPLQQGASAVAWFWGLMAAGCLVGMALLRFIQSKLVLRQFAAVAILCLMAALWGNGTVALHAFPLLGFLLSVMFPIIFALALNSVPAHHGAFAGILCTGIIGGAIGPLLVGLIGEAAGLRAGLTLAFVTLAYILLLSFRARPLVDNITAAPACYTV